MDIDNVCFQDGATSHISLKTVALFHKHKFPYSIISQHGDREWPTISFGLS